MFICEGQIASSGIARTNTTAHCGERCQVALPSGFANCLSQQNQSLACASVSLSSLVNTRPDLSQRLCSHAQRDDDQAAPAVWDPSPGADVRGGRAAAPCADWYRTETPCVGRGGHTHIALQYFWTGSYQTCNLAMSFLMSSGV